MRRCAKRGQALSIAAVLFLIMCVALIFVQSQQVEVEPIGTKQYDLLIKQEQAKAAQLYIDKSIALATKEATNEFIKNEGRYVEPTEEGQVAKNICGTHIYTTYTTATINCTPDFIANYVSYLQPLFNSYLNTYPLVALRFGHTLQITPANGQTTINGAIQSTLRLPLGRDASLVDLGDGFYPSSVLGSYGNEQPVSCGSAQCFSDVANLFYDLYSLDGTNLPYVWGGESPYSYEDSVALRDVETSVFHNYYGLTEKEPERKGRVSKFTVPGFDCSGWVWWVGKHASIEGLTSRTTANGFLNKARDLSGAVQVCDEKLEPGSCTQERIAQNAQAGDILFYAENKGSRATHIMFYNGDNEIIHSRGSLGLVREKIPPYYFRGLIGAYRFPYAPGGLYKLSDVAKPANFATGPLPPSAEGSEILNQEQEATASCELPVDLTQTNYDAIANYPIPSALEVVEKLKAANIYDSIQAAHKAYPTVPEALIVSIITAQTGTQLDGYLAGTHTCNEDGFCGLMGVDDYMCSRLTKEACDFDSFDKNNNDPNALTKGIMAGTAYLDYILTNHNDLQAPNYYWATVAYKGRPQVMDAIKEEVADRKKIPVGLVQWSDVEFGDVERGMPDARRNWAKQLENQQLIWRYTNYVGQALAQQCDGSLSASYVTRFGGSTSFLSYEPTITHTTDLDLELLSNVTSDFVPEITTRCIDELASCVQDYTYEFSSRTWFDITITSGNETESLAYSVLDQALDCYNNTQDDCYCDIVIDHTLTSSFESVGVKFKDTGEVYVGEQYSGGKFIRESVLLSELAKPLTGDALDTTDSNSYAELFIDENELRVDLQAPVQDKRYSTADAQTWGIGWYKPSKGLLQWAPLNNTHKRQLCRDNKHMFRFSAELDALPAPLTFSLFLNDTTPPQEVVFDTIEKHRCGLNNQGILFSWLVPNTSEQIYEFAFYETTEGINKPFHTIRAASFATPPENKETIRDAFKVYAEDLVEGRRYYTVINKDSFNRELNASTYTFTLQATDEYLNTNELVGSQEIELSDSFIELPTGKLGEILATDCTDIRSASGLTSGDILN